MSVYTPLSKAEISDCLTHYDIGALAGYAGINDGVTNTIYQINTDKGDYILTLFEDLTASELPFFLDLMSHCSQRGLACPDVIANKNGETICTLKKKPAVILSFLPGQTQQQITPQMRAAIGKQLAKLHLATADFPESLSNPRGLAWMISTAKPLGSVLTDEDKALLSDEIEFLNQMDFSQCPTGIIHADLFRDNVLFVEDEISGILDFYYACNDVLAYDLAIVANDWCLDEDGEFSAQACEELLAAYEQERAFTEAEKVAWPALLRMAALRFWLSRLLDFHTRERNELIQIKDPDEFKRHLQRHRLT